MDQSIVTSKTTANACLSKKTKQFHNTSDYGNRKAISALTKLLGLIDVNTHPNDFCFALRKRAQYYSMNKNFDDALKDLQTELDVARANRLHRRIDDVEELILRNSVLRRRSL